MEQFQSYSCDIFRFDIAGWCDICFCFVCGCIIGTSYTCSSWNLYNIRWNRRFCGCLTRASFSCHIFGMRQSAAAASALHTSIYAPQHVLPLCLCDFDLSLCRSIFLSHPLSYLLFLSPCVGFIRPGTIRWTSSSIRRVLHTVYI